MASVSATLEGDCTFAFCKGVLIPRSRRRRLMLRADASRRRSGTWWKALPHRMASTAQGSMLKVRSRIEHKSVSRGIRHSCLGDASSSAFRRSALIPQARARVSALANLFFRLLQLFVRGAGLDLRRTTQGSTRGAKLDSRRLTQGSTRGD